MIEYTCPATLGDIEISVFGKDAMIVVDQDCVMVMDEDGDLHAVRLQIDYTRNEWVEVSPKLFERDENAKSVWRAAEKHHAAKRDELMERAQIPARGNRYEHSCPIMGVGFNGNKYAA